MNLLFMKSIVGIVAGRIREKYNLPTIVFTKGKDMIKRFRKKYRKL